MASPSLLALAERVAMLAWRRNASPATLSLYNSPVQSLQHRTGSAVESRQLQPYRFPPWPPPPTSVLPTTTVLTVTTPGLATSLSALTSTGPTVSFSGPDTRPPSLASSVKPSSSGALVTDTMPTDISSPAAFPTTTDATAGTGSPNGGGSGITGNKTLLITLSTVLSVVGLVLVVGGILLCRRYRNRRQTFFSRGITPIDDDEIATWKVPRDEKSGYHGGETDAEADAMFAKETFGKETGGPSHGKHASTSSVKKPPSVIVYDNVHGRGRQSTDEAVPRRSFTQHPVYGKMSLEKALPQTPIHARAPNARAGLTDESVPGDEPYIPSPGRRSSRLSKLPPNSASSRRGHGRTRSSRSSTRSFGEYGYGGSDVELSPRHSHDQFHSSRNYYSHSHSRVYSSSSIPPRLSFGDEVLFSGASPGRPLFNKDEIGRAIG